MSKNLRSEFLLSCLLLSSFANGQQVAPDPHALHAPADELSSDHRSYGRYTEGPGLRFFQMLSASTQSLDAPFSFEEIIERSPVIARGYLIQVIPRRSIADAQQPLMPAIETVLLKLGVSDELKGGRQDVYLVEYAAHSSMVSKLNEEIYRGDLLVFLQPAHSFFGEDARIAISKAAEIELSNNQPLYSLALQSTLFTLSGSGHLTSPLDASPFFSDLYATIYSMDELASHIADILSRSQ